jgi:NitT/TauT family transport system ATP-binding protein
MPARITVDNLRVVFPGRGGTGPVEAVANLSLEAGEGQLVCIVGPSGCGKTTLLRVLAGLEEPTGGTVAIADFGFRISDLSKDTNQAESKNNETKSAIRNPQSAIVAMVFQNAGIFPWMTVEQNVAYGLQVRGMSVSERREVAHRWIGEIGLERFAKSYPAQLSGGMRQRVGLARAFAVDPQVLLMDEPFGALDAQTRLILQQTLLQQWERSHKTVLFVTHSIEEALTLGDRVLVMSARPGHILREFKVPFERPRDAALLRTDPRMGELFGEVWSVLRDEVERARV